jgi:hypothetical protein
MQMLPKVCRNTPNLAKLPDEWRVKSPSKQRGSEPSFHPHQYHTLHSGIHSQHMQPFSSLQSALESSVLPEIVQTGVPNSQDTQTQPGN